MRYQFAVAFDGSIGFAEMVARANVIGGEAQIE